MCYHKPQQKSFTFTFTHCHTILGDQIKQDEMDSECGRHGREEEHIYRTLCVKPEGKSHFGRPNRRWEGNITMDHKEKRSEIVDWVYRAQDREVVNSTEGTQNKLWHTS